MIVNAVSEATSRLRAAGVSVLDLTETNPTAAGISYPENVLSSLAARAAERYRPEPLGQSTAREAVAGEYAQAGVHLPAGDIVLTASTSDAYSVLFKLLCDPGDEVLVPQPSYPLFDWLCALDAVAARPYRSEYHGVWSIDRDALERQLSPQTRAVLVVSPNNPTGAVTRSEDRKWLVDLCASRKIPVIADEVFADYPHRGRAVDRHAGERDVLTFSLGGLSKSAGLPQVKLGWIAISGPEIDVNGALDRLSVICDTYLSVSTPVQIAAPDLIAAGRTIRQAIQRRIDRNLSALGERLGAYPALNLLGPDAGWSAVIRMPATIGEEAFVLQLLQDHHVLVHPGYFFDFPAEAFVVVSLLPEPQTFDDGIGELVTLASRA